MHSAFKSRNIWSGWHSARAHLTVKTVNELAALPLSTSVNIHHIYIYYMSNGLNLLHPRKDVAEMVIVFCVSLIVPEDLMFAIKSGEHVYQESSFLVSPLSFLRVSWWYQVSMSWCNCSKMSEVLAGAHMIIIWLKIYKSLICCIQITCAPNKLTNGVQFWIIENICCTYWIILKFPQLVKTFDLSGWVDSSQARHAWCSWLMSSLL